MTPRRPGARLASRARRRPVFAKTQGRPGRSASLSLLACIRGVKGLVVVLPASGSVSWAPKGGPIASAAIAFSVSWAPKAHLCLHKAFGNELPRPNERARGVTRTRRHDACLHFPTGDFLGRFSFWHASCMLAARSSAGAKEGAQSGARLVFCFLIFTLFCLFVVCCLFIYCLFVYCLFIYCLFIYCLFVYCLFICCLLFIYLLFIVYCLFVYCLLFVCLFICRLFALLFAAPLFACPNAPRLFVRRTKRFRFILLLETDAPIVL